MSKELKCCPFCGGEVKAYADNYNKVMISCDNCNMYFGIELEIGCKLKDGWKATYYSKEEAVNAWNTRKPIDRIVEQLEKEKEIHTEHYNISLYKDYPDVKQRYEQIQLVIDKDIEIVRKGGVNDQNRISQ